MNARLSKYWLHSSCLLLTLYFKNQLFNNSMICRRSYIQCPLLGFSRTSCLLSAFQGRKIYTDSLFNYTLSFVIRLIPINITIYIKKVVFKNNELSPFDFSWNKLKTFTKAPSSLRKLPHPDERFKNFKTFEVHW